MHKQMSTMSSKMSEESIKKLCAIGTGHKKDGFHQWFSYVSNELKMANDATRGFGDHGGGIEVVNYLQRENRQEDVPKFLELNRKLQANSVLCRKEAMLNFLLKTCEEKKTSFSRNYSLRTDNSSFTQSASTNTTPITPKSAVQQSSIGSVLTGKPTLNVDAIERPYFTVAQQRRDSAVENLLTSRARLTRTLDGSVSEHAVIQDLLFAFQGVGGEIFRDDFGDGSFRISTKVNPPLLHHAAYLAELGTLHVRVRRMIDAVPLIGAPNCLTALATALRLQLNEFCRLIAQLEAQLHQDGGSQLSMLRIRAVTGVPQLQMKWLATVADICKDKKGGALLSALHSLMQHGDPKVQTWLEPLLIAASRPFYEMLAQWLKEGHIEDPYSEFFVAVDSGASQDNFWHHKFSIRETMRPSFISKSQAGTVLATGKSVAFLQELCMEASEPLKFMGVDAALNAANKLDARTLWAMDGELQACIEAAHRDVSRRALAVMLNEGKLSLHLQALRNYLLLGKGDFVRQLMENLMPKLSQPASNLFTHQLTPLLDSAIRATNAQYDDPDVLARLDVKLMQMSPGEIGWDTFTLRYCVDGPIAMIFTNEVTTKYLCLFNALWRAKRMEWVLSNLWKRQTTSARMLRKITELTPVLRETLLLISEMNQFVRQMQYYLLFESVECQWSELQQAVAQAPSLDQLIQAHDRFLSSVMRRALLDEDSAPLLTQLRSVYNSVLLLQSIETKLSELAHKELERRNKKLLEEERLEQENKFGTSDEMVAAEQKKRREFRLNIKAVRGELRSLASSYQEMVKLFLLALASHTNEDLQFLSYRLDFNEHYKNSDKRLSTPFTLDFRRRSGKPDMSMSTSLLF
jgi:gamma-tubulin complex component 3